MKKEEQDALNRYRLILKILKDYKGTKKEFYLNLIETLVKQVINYFQAVIQLETFTKIQRFRLEQEEYIEKLIEQDQRKKIAHEALISQLNIVNRNLFADPMLKGKIPIGGIFSLDPKSIQNRIAIAEWAKHFIEALRNKKIIQKNERDIFINNI